MILAEIVMFEGLTVVYRSNVDLFFYVVGRAEENEVYNGFCVHSTIILNLQSEVISSCSWS